MFKALISPLLLLALLLIPAFAGLPARPPPPPPDPAAPPDTPPANAWMVCPGPGKFITCLCASEKSLWVGTEDTGLWQLDLSADATNLASWKPMNAADGPGNDIYALAVDSAGRLWAGTLNRGVSVYNGKDWKTYGVLEGCSGERVFGIAADPDPKRGNVWIGTDHGLTCWRPTLETAATPTGVTKRTAATPTKSSASSTAAAAPPQSGQGTWLTFTRADGLPSAQIYAVAVAADGRVWAGRVVRPALQEMDSRSRRCRT
jgi:hypothetical protein